MVKRIYQKSRVLGGGLSVLRFIFDEIRQRATRISGAWGQGPNFLYFCFTARATLTVSDWSRRPFSSSERIPQKRAVALKTWFYYVPRAKKLQGKALGSTPDMCCLSILSSRSRPFALKFQRK